MILVDTSVWIDHLRDSDPVMQSLLEADMVVMHPFVLGELALGRLASPKMILQALGELPQAIVATDAEVIDVIFRHGLVASGIGYVDAHLLAAAALTVDTGLWTRDRRLDGIAARLGLAASPLH